MTKPVVRSASELVANTLRVDVDGADILHITTKGAVTVTIGDGEVLGQELVAKFKIIKPDSQTAVYPYPSVEVAGEQGISTTGYVVPSFTSDVSRAYQNDQNLFPVGDARDPWEAMLFLKWTGKVWNVIGGTGFATHPSI
jgi:hypothetical protein